MTYDYGFGKLPPGECDIRFQHEPLKRALHKALSEAALLAQSIEVVRASLPLRSSDYAIKAEVWIIKAEAARAQCLADAEEHRSLIAKRAPAEAIERLFNKQAAE